MDSAEAKASQGTLQGKFLSAEGMSATVQQLLWAELWVEVFSLPSLLSVFKRNGGDDGTGIRGACRDRAITLSTYNGLSGKAALTVSARTGLGNLAHLGCSG